MSFTCKKEMWKHLSSLAANSGAVTIKEFLHFVKAYYTQKS
ncbi:hypothetical protein [Sulfurospirillum tamanense]|nr:hypothetical protein [Sulfurospirillum tamanensis]